MWNRNQKRNKQTNETKQQTYRYKKMAAPEGRGWREGKTGEGVKSVLMDRNHTFGGEDTIEHTNIKLQYSTPEMYVM